MASLFPRFMPGAEMQPVGFDRMMSASRVFGHIAAHAVGSSFASRRELYDSAIHRQLQGGISGTSVEGADSIVVSGGYEDDEDYGDVIIYTGQGGNVGGVQVEDQRFKRGNKALAISCDRGLPVRVVRGRGGDPAHSPQ
jgi:putative restriction endonuclease